MKEKTFEQLIRERIDKGDAFTPTGIIEMMQQVREATIAECRDIAFFEHSSTVEIHKQIISLEVDRIILTENK